MTALVIGLGNPGGEYARTRHNVGWWCVEALAGRGGFGRERRDGPAWVRSGAIGGVDVVLARPRTYMNLSGRAGTHLTRTLGVPPSSALVVHDEVDLRLGRVQLKRGGGHGGQKGVLSLIESWQTKDFLRLRIGVGRPPEGTDTSDHVLTSFLPDELPVMEDSVTRAADAVTAVLTLGEEEAMNRVNRRREAGDG